MVNVIANGSRRPGSRAAAEDEIAYLRRSKSCLQLVVFGLILYIFNREFRILAQPEQNRSTPSVTTTATIGHRTHQATEEEPPSPRIQNSSQQVVTATTTTITNSSIGKGGDGGLFYCGYVQQLTGLGLFPDYAQRYQGGYDDPSHQELELSLPPFKNDDDEAQRRRPGRRKPTPNDILIFGMHGPCRSAIEGFPGKVLVLNGEFYGDDMATRTKLVGRPNVGDDIYQIGLVGDYPKSHTINSYYMVWGIFLMYWNRHQREGGGGGEQQFLRKLLDPSHKPINNGKYNAILYANSGCHPHRERAINEISSIVSVHVGGKCKGEKPHRGNFTLMPTPRTSWTSNYLVQKDYKYCFAMENQFPYQKYYITEKILNPFLAGCIPVYYGTPEIFDIFNPKAMIYYDPNDPTPALNQLQNLQTNDTLYNDILYNQPILAHGNETLRKYFSLLDEIEGGYLKKRIRTMMGV